MKDCPAIGFGCIKGKKKLQATVWRRKMVAAHLKITDSQLIEAALLLTNECPSPAPICQGDPEVKRCEKIVTYVKSHPMHFQFSPSDHPELDRALCYSRDLYNLEDLSEHPFDNGEMEDSPTARAEFLASSLTHLQLLLDEELSFAISSFLPKESPQLGDLSDGAAIERMRIARCRQALSSLVERTRADALSIPTGKKQQRVIKNSVPPPTRLLSWEERVTAQLRDLIVCIATESSCEVMTFSSHQASNQYLSMLSETQVTDFRLLHSDIRSLPDLSAI
jgi:hypothetical protein